MPYIAHISLLAPTVQLAPSMKTLLMLGLLSLASIAGCAADDSSDDDAVASEGASALSASSNEHAAFTFFLGKGLTRVQSAAVVGNLMQESSVNPASRQPGGLGRGIAQWSVGDRWDHRSGDNLAWFARTHGGSPMALHTQLEFLWYELETFPSYGLASLRNATSLSSAELVFQQRYEACGRCNQQKRLQYAQQVLNAFASDRPAASGASSSAGSSDSGCYSPTLDRDVGENTCVLSASNGNWYECSHGAWVPRASDPVACSAQFP